MSDCKAGTIAPVIAINEAGDRGGDIWAHTEYSSSYTLSAQHMYIQQWLQWQQMNTAMVTQWSVEKRSIGHPSCPRPHPIQ